MKLILDSWMNANNCCVFSYRMKCCKSSRQLMCWGILLFAESLPLDITSVSVTSSMNLWIIQDGFRSSMYAIKIKGPSHEPWGMPPVILAQSERKLPSLTLCCLSLRNEKVGKKVMSQWQTFLRACPHHGGKTAGIDMVWKNNVAVTLCVGYAHKLTRV